MISVVIPVYRNAAGIPALLEALEALNVHFDGDLEAVFVVDGSPDDSLLRLGEALPSAGFRSQLLGLSRNFGSFAAIRAGMGAVRGDFVVVMAADLQEPPELIVEFHEQLKTGEYDIAIGQRQARDDPWAGKLAATAFWAFYRRFVESEIPPGGVDVFACTRAVAEQLLRLQESNSSLIGLLFWVGFRRVLVPYERRARHRGVSAWTFTKKLRYLTDSVFGFTDLPIRLLLYAGLLGLVTSVTFALVVGILKLVGAIAIPGYAATVVVVTFFGGLNCFGLGIIGGYVWRTFENTKSRPNSIVVRHTVFEENQSCEVADHEQQLLSAPPGTGRDE